MEKPYQLYRGNQLISSQHSAGRLHDIGQPGDTLVCWDSGELTVFLWNDVHKDPTDRFWIYSSVEALHPEVRLTLLLQS